MGSLELFFCRPHVMGYGTVFEAIGDTNIVGPLCSKRLEQAVIFADKYSESLKNNLSLIGQLIGTLVFKEGVPKLLPYGFNVATER